MKIERFDDRGLLDAALVRRLEHALEAGGGVMLSGGNTPRPAYAELGARRPKAHASLKLLYSDERYVPSTSEASNYRASLPLLQGLHLGDDRVLRVRTELAAQEAAADYERRLAESSAPICFGLLGLGTDGHTASLFSSDDLERAAGHLAVDVQRPDGMQAITVTPALLRRIEHILMVVVGREKWDALAAFIKRDSGSIAWRAVSGCADVEIWCATDV
jgi:6-phosphogluconolactonase